MIKTMLGLLGVELLVSLPWSADAENANPRAKIENNMFMRIAVIYEIVWPFRNPKSIYFDLYGEIQFLNRYSFTLIKEVKLRKLLEDYF